MNKKIIIKRTCQATPSFEISRPDNPSAIFAISEQTLV